MYTGPLVRDEHQLDDNDGKWLKELSLQISKLAFQIGKHGSQWFQ